MDPLNWKTMAAMILVVACGNAGAEPFPAVDTLLVHEFKEARVKLSAPRGWSYQMQSNEGAKGLFYSRQIAAAQGRSAADVSLNVVSFPLTEAQGALAYATSFAVAYPQKFGTGAECGWKKGEPLTLFWCQADLEDSGHTTTVLHHLIANSTTGKLYIFTFDTLREDWAQSWPTITTMLKSIVVDPTF